METLTFRYFSGFVPLAAGLGIFFACGFFGVLVVGTKYGWLLSPKGILILAIGIVGNLTIWGSTVMLWQTSWRFTLTPTSFIAEHRLRRERIEVPWNAITRVSKHRLPWWLGWAGAGLRGFSRIETADGHQIVIGVHLLDYRGFIDELRARAVNCRVFEPYYDEIESW